MLVTFSLQLCDVLGKFALSCIDTPASLKMFVDLAVPYT